MGESKLIEYALQQGPLIFVLTVIIIGGARKLWVYGWQYNEVKAQRDEAMELQKSANESNKELVNYIKNSRVFAGREK